jgi:hypothetical protein
MAKPTFRFYRSGIYLDALILADISPLQQILPLVHDLVPPKYHPLLQLSRTLAEIALHAQMKMQTESRLRSGEALIAKFNAQLPVRSHQSNDVLLILAI